MKGVFAMKLNNESALKFSLEFGRTAIEHDYFPKYDDAEDLADAVYTFCDTLYKKFTESSEN